MSIRSQVQDEASKAAAKIREAIEEFTKATGLQPVVSAKYFERPLGFDCITRDVSRQKSVLLVTVSCGGVESRSESSEDRHIRD